MKGKLQPSYMQLDPHLHDTSITSIQHRCSDLSRYLLKLGVHGANYDFVVMCSSVVPGLCDR